MKQLLMLIVKFGAFYFENYFLQIELSFASCCRIFDLNFRLNDASEKENGKTVLGKDQPFENKGLFSTINKLLLYQ